MPTTANVKGSFPALSNILLWIFVWKGKVVLELVSYLCYYALFDIRRVF